MCSVTETCNMEKGRSQSFSVDFPKLKTAIQGETPKQILQQLPEVRQDLLIKHTVNDLMVREGQEEVKIFTQISNGTRPNGSEIGRLSRPSLINTTPAVSLAT